MTAPSMALDGASGPISKPTDLRSVRFFLLTLGILLAGYAFLGRGFAHLGLPPLYLGEFVLALGLVVTAVAARRSHLQIARSRVLVLLLAFMVLGLICTVPYIPTDGVNALRDATVWGYAVFALMLFVLLDRDWVVRLFRLYGYMAVAFVFWGPVAFFLFYYHLSSIPMAPGSDVQILFFKQQDMAVQTAAAIAFLVVGTPLISRIRDFLWRFAAALPATWMVYTTGTLTRGGLAAVACSLGLLSLISGRVRSWLPILAGAVVVAAVVVSNVSVSSLWPPSAPTPTPISVPTSGPSNRSPGPSLTPSHSPSHSPSPSPSPTPAPAPITGRATTTTQWWDNIFSIFGSSDSDLQITKQFRLDWWGKIVNYTFHGPYFWMGKGFGINLADDDGFPNTDHSLREPHNTELSILARMGVPGFFLWDVLQAAWFLLLLRALLIFRRIGDKQLASVAAWVLVFWVAIMVDSSFDPYIEGPQGGIWFWTLFGVGLVLMRLVPRHWREASRVEPSPAA